ncbi:MAG: putative addiction module antidote protein [Verrucomicrobia bacterium]|nr:putative addiction module antidote protein [Verrucomicrobiota bacterium]
MKLVSYRDNLMKRLEDPEYAAEYLNAVLAENDPKALLIALKDVVDARGGVGALSEKVPLQRQSLYKVLSAKGNPTIETLGQILRHLGLRLSVAQA